MLMLKDFNTIGSLFMHPANENRDKIRHHPRAVISFWRMSRKRAACAPSICV